MSFNIKIDGIEEITKELEKDIFSEIFTRTINDVVPSITTATIREVKRNWNIGSKRLKLDDGKYAKPHTWAFTRKSGNIGKSRLGHVKFSPARVKGSNKIAYINVHGASMPLSLFETNPSYSRKELSLKQRAPSELPNP